MGKPIEGILLVDKAEGESSFHVVKRIKPMAPKVGHAGTLDPFATGLLILLLGQGTKLSNFLMEETKTYLAVMRLGVETETLDPTGQVTMTRNVPDLPLEAIEQAGKEFVGEIEQSPPSFSALKVDGERAYKLARKGVKFDLRKRKVTVHALRILSVDLPDVTLEVRCSKGTYIRSLAADMGQRLGTGGHLRDLRRLASGYFHAADALSSEDIPRTSPADLRERVIPLRDALPGMDEIQVKELLAEKIRHGYQPSWEELAPGIGFTPIGYGRSHLKLVQGEDLVALVGLETSPGLMGFRPRIKRVFM
jgi:tRNA pseudouridine55 synthase